MALLQTGGCDPQISPFCGGLGPLFNIVLLGTTRVSLPNSICPTALAGCTSVTGDSWTDHAMATCGVSFIDFLDQRIMSILFYCSRFQSDVFLEQRCSNVIASTSNLWSTGLTPVELVVFWLHLNDLFPSLCTIICTSKTVMLYIWKSKHNFSRN